MVRKTNMRQFLRLYFSLVVILFCAQRVQSFDSPFSDQLGPGATAKLVAEVTHFVPGQPFWAGLYLELEPDWHVYWRNPGDAGLPPKIKWQLPEGWTAGDFQWPYPERITIPPLVDFGYSEELLLLVQITPPSTVQAGDSVVLRGHASWLSCKEACIPEQGDVSLTLIAHTDAPTFNTGWMERFNAVRERLPLPSHDWNITSTAIDNSFIVSISPPSWFKDSLGDLFFFPYDKGVMVNAEPQQVTHTDKGYTLAISRFQPVKEEPTHLKGILVSSTGWRGSGSERSMEVDIPIGSGAEAMSLFALFRAVLFAFIGGMILNLMPCVLPVLSLKILGFVQKAGENPRTVMMHGLIFTAGVLVSFWTLAGALLALRAGGEQLGWGFQLQSPEFVLILAGFMFLFGLNMLGVFEIGTSLTAVGGVASGSGWMGSFMNGVTATMVATPCTAPFMGSALGFSLSQPPLVSLLIFTSLGLGMAFPYVLLSASPRLLKYLPRPGAWMETLKQVMGFFLLATVIWLAWVFSLQVGAFSTVILLGTLFFLGIAGWIYGRWATIVQSTGVRRTAQVASLLFIVGGLAIGLVGAQSSLPTRTTAATGDGSADGISWQEYSPEKVKLARDSGKSVFVDFTAAWCLSCQVNEKIAFSNDDVIRRFGELNIVPFKADWTSRDSTITQALAEFGRNSVPLYVFYSDKNAPTVLPEILTPGIVLEALNNITN
jgi:thiol:disulfide interchange protein